MHKLLFTFPLTTHWKLICIDSVIPGHTRRGKSTLLCIQTPHKFIYECLMTAVKYKTWNGMPKMFVEMVIPWYLLRNTCIKGGTWGLNTLLAYYRLYLPVNSLFMVYLLTRRTIFYVIFFRGISKNKCSILNNYFTYPHKKSHS